MVESHDAEARRYLARRPTGKFQRVARVEERVAIRHLWSLLYRAVRRDAQRLNDVLRSVAALARRIGGLATQLTALTSRVEALERRVYDGRAHEHDGRPSPCPRRRV